MGACTVLNYTHGNTTDAEQGEMLKLTNFIKLSKHQWYY